jgi:hypothetical protein
MDAIAIAANAIRAKIICFVLASGRSRTIARGKNFDRRPSSAEAEAERRQDFDELETVEVDRTGL